MSIYDYSVKAQDGSNESQLYTYLKAQKGFAGFDQEHPLTPMLESVLNRLLIWRKWKKKLQNYCNCSEEKL